MPPDDQRQATRERAARRPTRERPDGRSKERAEQEGAERPRFASGSRLLKSAWRFARDAHHGPRSHDGTRIDHPVEVAGLVDEAGFDEHVVAAALLHDVVEDTDAGIPELRERFGERVADLVDALTEDATIDDYRERKAAHRARVARAGREAAAIFAADKLAGFRALDAQGKLPPPAKLEHYAQTVRILREAHAGLPFLDELDRAVRPHRRPTEEAEVPDLHDSELYLNRELSWLDFNDRVLQLAEDPGRPLLERLKFCAIYTSNLDEFFMVRVAGVHDQADAGIDARGPDGLAPRDVLRRVTRRARELDERLVRCFERDLRPALAEHGIRIMRWEDLSEEEQEELTARYERQIHPALTPLAVGAARPFPYISNLSLSLAVLVRDPVTDHTVFARVKVPKEVLPRFMATGDGLTLVPMEDVIAQNLGRLFPGMEIIAHSVFRVARDADFTISDEADDLLEAVEAELRRRRFGEVVRLEIAADMHPLMRSQLTEALDVDDEDVFEVEGLLDMTDLWQVVGLPGFKELRQAPWTPTIPPALQPPGDGPVDLFAAMRAGDLLVHHPYDSFSASVEAFVQQATADPDVLAIKQTVYRTSDDSPLVPALIRAAERGKQTVCLVELKARFDERANIQWARALEEAGVHVTYGIPGLKAHAKAILVVRREGEGVRHYVHIGTGNYHPANARLYTDFGLFTTDERVTSDVADMFNYLTGYARPQRYRRVLVAPTHLRHGILAEIERTVAARGDGRDARIAMKMNALVDAECIRALYRASQAGVRVQLNVRGICCLRPGVPGVSEGIEVVSVVGRFLEHSRVFAFQRGEDSSVYVGSADLMPRNLDTRVELVTPVEDEEARAAVLDVLERSLADQANAWTLGPEGAWTPRGREEGARSVHDELMEEHLRRSSERAQAVVPPGPGARGGRA